jgi:hypothetical protein
MKTILHNVNTTAVPEKDLPLTPKVKLINAPEDLDTAIKRIMALEMALEDISRAAEIVSITGQLSILDSFKRAADTTLESKIQIEQPDMNENFKLTVITDKEESTSAETK